MRSRERLHGLLDVPGAITIPGWALPLATVLLLVLVCLFGGGTRQAEVSDALVEIGCLPVLALALLNLASSGAAPIARWALLLIVGILALPLLQLVILPPDVWTSLPNRQAILHVFEAAGLATPWLPISMNPMGTWRSFVSLLPAITMFLAVLSVGPRGRRALLLAFFTIVLISFVLDVLQTVGGQQSPLRFYAITNPDRAVGFFANANHNAAFLYCAVPYLFAWTTGMLRDGLRNRIRIALITLFFIALFVGLALIKSRAGLVLGALACVASTVLVWERSGGADGRRRIYLAVGVNLIALLLVFQFGFVSLIGRIEHSEISNDLRWQAASITFKAARESLPLGTGLGSFVQIYKMNEPRSDVGPHYMNHAHNDWLELLLEGGLPAYLLVAGFFAWFVVANLRLKNEAWMRVATVDRAIARAGSVAVVLLLLHSAFDYPLRTETMMTMFALSCALLVPPPLPKES